jgi:hypothetical protein
MVARFAWLNKAEGPSGSIQHGQKEAADLPYDGGPPLQ